VAGELDDAAVSPSGPLTERRSIVMLAPVYAAAAQAAGPSLPDAPACAGVRGFVLIAAWPDQIAAAAFRQVTWRSNTLSVVDLSAPSGRRLLVGFNAAGQDEDTILESSLHVQSVDVGGREWGVFVGRTLGGDLNSRFAMPLAALFIGLTFTGLVAGHLRRERRVKALYQTEARARAAMTRALRVNEERFHLALRHSRIILANLNRDLRYTWFYDPQTMRSTRRWSAAATPTCSRPRTRSSSTASSAGSWKPGSAAASRCACSCVTRSARSTSSSSRCATTAGTSSA